MNITYLTADFGIPVYGNKGASIHVREMSEALQDIGHDVRILTPRLSGSAPTGFDIPVHEIKLASAEKAVMDTLKNDPACDDAMSKEIRSMVYAATLRAAAKDLFRFWRPDAIYERYSLLASAGADLAREYDLPFILEVNAPLSDEAAKHRGLGFQQTVKAIEQKVLHAATAIVAVSDEVKAWVVGLGVDGGRVHVLPNGVNAARFSQPAEGFRKPAELADKAVVGFVGTLKKWHGTETLVQAMSSVIAESNSQLNPHLLIVGDGPERGTLDNLVSDLGISDHVTFTGSVPHEEIPAWISAMDIAVAPYDALTDFYFSPLKLYEYMAAGKAIIASDIGQINSIVRHEQTGLLYEPGNTQALAGAITRLLADRDLALSLGDTAREEATANHSWHRNAEAVTQLIRQGRGVPAETAFALEGSR